MGSQTKKLTSNIGTLSIIGLLLLIGSMVNYPPLAQEAQPPSPQEAPVPDAPQGRSPTGVLFSYQGQLLDAADEPIEGKVEMIFSLYHQETGNVPFWTETYTGTQAITVTNGLFHVLLGSLVAIDPTELTGDVYLELTVNGETLSPRELFTSVAYAVEAETLPAGAATQGDMTVRGNLFVTETLHVDGAIYSTQELALNPARNVRIAVGGSANANSADDGNIEFQADGSFIFREQDDRNQTVMSINANSGNVEVSGSSIKLSGGTEDLFSFILEGTDDAGIKNSWRLYQMNDYNGRHAFEIWEYVDGDGDGVYCDGDGGICGGRFAINAEGNIGIGTVSPAIDLAIEDTDTGFQLQGDGQLAIYTDNIERVRISNNGNVGIGATSPEQLLDVRGNARIVNTLYLQVDDQSFIKGNIDSSMAAGHWENIYMLIDHDNNSASSEFVIAKDGDTPSTATELFRVQENGYVGIGTANPLADLHIQQGSAGYTSVYNNAGIFIENSAASFLELGTVATDWTAVLFGDKDSQGAGKVLYHNDGDYMALYTDGGEKVRIKSDGNVGIGTTSPSEKLDVNGNARVSGSLTTGGNLTVDGTDLYLTGRGGGRALVDYSNNGYLEINYANDFGGWKITGPAKADMNMNGHGINNCGALVEANLQTQEELAAGQIDRFGEGDVLCWGLDRLELCATANDRLVQAVADARGRPIVLGAEVIKVLGPVKRGDILVASDVPGYAMVNNDPVSGSVIAQALEDFDGERGVIKAMIRKF